MCAWPDIVQWEDTPGRLEIPGEAQVHIWKLDFSLVEDCSHKLKGLLSKEESARLDQLSSAGARMSYSLVRGSLRIILTNYLGTPAEKLSIVHDEFGRPSLSCEQFPGSMQFNLSHSTGRALFAFSGKLPLGIDLESEERKIGAKGLTERILATGERCLLQSLSEEGREQEAVIAWWTLKEAILKLAGKGIRLPFDKLEITKPFDARPLLVNYDPAIYGDLNRLSLHRFRPCETMTGALAVLHPEPALTFLNADFLVNL